MQVGIKYTSYLPTYEDGTECSETSAYKIQTPGNYPEESIQQNNSYLFEAASTLWSSLIYYQWQNTSYLHFHEVAVGGLSYF